MSFRLILAHARVILASLLSTLHDTNRMHAEFTSMIERAENNAAKLGQEIEQHDQHILDATRAAHNEIAAVYQRLNSITSVHDTHINALDDAKSKAEVLAANLKTLLAPNKPVLIPPTTQGAQ